VFAQAIDFIDTYEAGSSGRIRTHNPPGNSRKNGGNSRVINAYTAPANSTGRRYASPNLQKSPPARSATARMHARRGSSVRSGREKVANGGPSHTGYLSTA